MPPFSIIDTHLHLVDRSRLDYPWLEDAGPLNDDWPLARYATEARRLGIARALHMEVDVAAADITAETARVSELASQRDSLICGIIAACRPEHDGFSATVEQAQDNALVKGFRRVLHVVPDGVSQSTNFRDNIRRLSVTDLTFDLCVRADQIPLAIELADLAPEVSFILDHCGVPDIRGGAFAFWRDRITEIAKRPNVSAKISGVVAYTDTGKWRLDDLAPYVGHVTDAFGFDRLVWGGDWPVCTLGGGLSTWVGATQALFAGASNDERRQLFSANAERIWGLQAA